MHVLSVKRPGQKGTQALVERYGTRLVCVRYRYDAAKQRRFKTVELIIEQDVVEGRKTLVHSRRSYQRPGTRIPCGQEVKGRIMVSIYDNRFLPVATRVVTIGYYAV